MGFDHRQPQRWINLFKCVITTAVHKELCYLFVKILTHSRSLPTKALLFTLTGRTTQMNCRHCFTSYIKMLASFIVIPFFFVAPSFCPCRWIWLGTGDASLPGVCIIASQRLIHHSWCFATLPASQLISPLSLHHPSTLLCELLLQCKVTVPVTHCEKVWFWIDVRALLAEILESQ